MDDAVAVTRVTSSVAAHKSLALVKLRRAAFDRGVQPKSLRHFEFGKIQQPFSDASALKRWGDVKLFYLGVFIGDEADHNAFVFGNEGITAGGPLQRPAFA